MGKANENMGHQVTWEGHVTRVRPEKEVRAKQDVHALFGVNGVSTPSKHLSLLVTALRPGEKSNAHYHLEHESALYGIKGSVHFFWGAELEQAHSRRGRLLLHSAILPTRVLQPQSHNRRGFRDSANGRVRARTCRGTTKTSGVSSAFLDSSHFTRRSSSCHLTTPSPTSVVSTADM